MSVKSRRSRSKDKYTKDLESFISMYIAATGDAQWTTPKVASWVIDNNLWEQRKLNAVRQLSRELSRVARQATFIDDDGREVRKYHAYRLGPQQPMLWTEIDKITRKQMDESKTMRRNKLVSGAIKITMDLGHFNDYYNPGDALLFDPDLTHDIEDHFHPKTYEDSPPDDGKEEVKE